MKRAGVAMGVFVLMLWAAGAQAARMLHESLSERPEIRALQEQMIALEERCHEMRMRGALIDVEVGLGDAQARRDVARARFGLAEEGWALARDARELWRPAVLLADEKELALDEEAVQLYTDAVTFAVNEEMGAITAASETDMRFRLEGGLGRWPGRSFRERLDELTRKLAEIQSEGGAENVRPEPGVLHRPARDEARWLAEGAYDLARAAREQAVNQSPAESFALYVQCATFSLLADAYFLELWAPPH